MREASIFLLDDYAYVRNVHVMSSTEPQTDEQTAEERALEAAYWERLAKAKRERGEA